jgi:DNA-binding transcriptional regulator YiaG
MSIITIRRLDPARVDAARKEMHDAVQAERLADIRKAHGHARQSDVAALMGISQARVSKLESGDLRTRSWARCSLTSPRSAGACESLRILAMTAWS